MSGTDCFTCLVTGLTQSLTFNSATLGLLGEVTGTFTGQNGGTHSFDLTIADIVSGTGTWLYVDHHVGAGGGTDDRTGSGTYVALAPVVVVPSDHFLCYKTALAKGQPKFLAVSKSLKDQFGGPESFDVKAVVSICNPADKNNEGTRFPDVHEEGFKIAAPKGAPKFVKSDHITVDQFGTLSLTISGPATLLDVTPKAITPPDPFPSDPTSNASVNRFKCYKASIAKGTQKFIPPLDPTVTDEFLTGQALHLTKVTKLCTPVDKEGETPGAEARANHLVCYQAKLPKGAPKFTPQTVSTNSTNFGRHTLVAKGVSELCVPAKKDPPTIGVR